MPISNPQSPIPLIFDRRTQRLYRSRAARTAPSYDFMLRQMSERLMDRLADLRRSFPVALDLNYRGGQMAKLPDHPHGIGRLVQMDSCFSLLDQSSGSSVQGDEEWLPFAAESFDLVLSCGTLHRVNDLPGTLAQIKNVLKPGGVFMAIFPGGETLLELRDSLMQAELSETGGASPRISPFVDVRDAGALLQRAGFALPVADSERLTVHYKNAQALFSDLRGMGEANALTERPKTFLRRRTLQAAVEYYQRHYSIGNGRIAATFDLIGITGWKPV